MVSGILIKQRSKKLLAANQLSLLTVDLISHLGHNSGQFNGTSKDFDLVYDKLKDILGLENKNQAKQWLSEQGLTPHHLDETTIQLIPT